MIIGLSGIAGSGKDTVADYLVTNYRFVKMSLADEIKRTAKCWYGFTDDQLWGPSELRNTYSPKYPDLMCRTVLQKLGTEVARGIYKDTWVNILLDYYHKIISEPRYIYNNKTGLNLDECYHYNTKGVVIPDVRWPDGNEGLRIRKEGGKLLRVKGRSGNVDTAHESESLQLLTHDSHFDFVITNDGLIQDTYAQVDSFMNKVQ